MRQIAIAMHMIACASFMTNFNNMLGLLMNPSKTLGKSCVAKEGIRVNYSSQNQ